jgi:hypothetical protein
MRSLDKRFASDLAYLIDRDGPDEVAQILIRASERVGFRGALEEEVYRHVLARHSGRRVDLLVVGGGR